MQRQNRDEETSAVEQDRGLFKSGVVSVRLDLSPMLKRSSRGDLVVAGFIEGSEIEVVFPGRREKDTGPLKAAIACLAARVDKPKGAVLPIMAHGSWRTRVIDTDDFRAERVYQFVAAEWQVEEQDCTYGEPPQI